MAKMINSNDVIEDISVKLNQISEDLDNELRQEMLDTGAEAIEFCWVKSIKKHKHVDTGSLVNSVKTSRSSRGKSKRVISPHGKDENGVKNMEKAFDLNYGKSGLLGSRFVEEAEDEADVEAALAMQDVFFDYLDKNGYL